MSWNHKTASFLYKAINSLPNDAQHTAIRSQMMLKCRNILNAPPDKLHRCSACGVDLHAIIPNHQIKPAHVKPRFLKHQLRKDKYNRTKYQELYVAKYSKGIQTNQIMVIKCQLCQKEYNTDVEKPKNLLTANVVKPPITKSQRKKQRRRALALADLKEFAVLQAKQNLLNNNTPSTSKQSSELLELTPNKIDIISNHDYISLVTPNNNSIISNQADISLVTPNNNSIISNHDYISLITPKNNSIISVNDTPNSINSNAILLDTPLSNCTPISTPNIVKTNQANLKFNKSVKDLKAHITPINTRSKKIKPFREQKLMKKKHTNIVLESMSKKSDKKSKKLNALADMLSNTQLSPKPQTMLQSFLQGFD